MNHEELLIKTDAIHSKCKQVLSKKKKNRELPSDRLFQFHLAANLRQKKLVSAIADMMTKHTTQLYTMIEANERGEDVTIKEWRETLIDEINYRYIMLVALEDE